MSTYGFSTLYVGIIGLIAAFSIPGDQLILASAGALLMGHGAVRIVLSRFGL